MLRLALVCDFLEERWPSMDLVGDMLFDQFSTRLMDQVNVDRIRPALRARLSTLPGMRSSKFAWNADRLLNRMADYPRLLGRRLSNYDLYHIVDHSYAQLVHEVPPERTIVSCHDLDTFRCLTQPEIEPRSKWFRAIARRVLDGFQRAAHVICDSEAVRNSALKSGLLNGDRVTVIHNGIHPSCSSGPDTIADAAANRLLGVPPEALLLLNVGSTIPRKRIDLLLKIFAAVREQVPAARLVRVGGPFTKAQLRLASQLRIADDILELPFLSREVLAAVYRRSTLLLQTSEAEGFGLPLVEAMACGCQVVASDIPVLREIGGDAATFCPVGEVVQWAETVARLLHEKSVGADAWSLRNLASGRNARRFSWEQTANQTLDLYKRISSH